MAKLDQTSMPQFKRCSKCGEVKPITLFFKNKTKCDGMASSCKACALLYQQTNKHCRDYQLQWRRAHGMKPKKYAIYNSSSEKRCSKCGAFQLLTNYYKATTGHLGYSQVCKSCDNLRKKLWNKTTKGKLSIRKYEQSPKRIMSHYRAEDRRSQTDKRKAYNKKYYEENPYREKERYHNLQDKYGHYGYVNSWYPGARVIEALETAPIVEIKA